MYRIETRWLDDALVPPSDVATHVAFWYDTPPLGGTAIDASGNLYLEDLTSDSILKLSPEQKITTILKDNRLHWMDAAWIKDGWLYIPEAQIDRADQFHRGQSQIHWPLHLYRLNLDE
jgi:hypothetical protein